MNRTLALAAAVVVLGAIILLVVQMGGGAKPIVVDDPAPAATTSRPAEPVRPITASRFADGRPASASRAFGLEVEVIAPDGTPAADARVVIYREEEILGAATTDAHGLAAFASGEGEAGIVVAPTGSPLHVATIAITAGRRRIELPPGVEISGRVEVNGAAPVDPVALGFEFEGATPDLPWKVWTDLNRVSFATAVTDRQGGFTLRGLRTGSSWRVRGSLGYRLDDVLVGGQATFIVPAPASDVVVKLKRLPIVRGRAVSDDLRVPVAGCSLEVKQTGLGEGSSQFGPVKDDGRFEFTVGAFFGHGINVQSVTRVVVRILGPNRIGEKTVVLDPAPEEDHDLGDVLIPVGRKIVFVVKSVEGVPIEGAFARVTDDAVPSSKTDAKGRGEIRVDPETKSFRVGALKYAVATVPIPDVIPDVLPVTLQPGTGLEIRVSPVSMLPWLRVRLSCSGNFGGEVAHPLQNDDIYVAAGATMNNTGWRSSNGASTLFEPKADGRVIVFGLKSDMAVTVAAVDRLDEAQVSKSVTLLPGEQRTVALEVTKAPRTLRGHVWDPEGKPVKDAYVVVRADRKLVGARSSTSDGRGFHGTTDDKGRFELPGIFSDVIHFEVDKRGFIPAVRRDFVIPQGDPEIGVKLSRGVKIDVKVVEADGTLIRDQTVWLETPGLPRVIGQSREPGTYSFEDVPIDVTATASTSWGGQDVTRSFVVKGNQTEQLTMPPLGTVVLDLSALGPPPFHVSLIPVGHDAPKAERSVSAPSEEGSWDRRIKIFPVVPGDYIAHVERRSDGKTAEVAEPQRLSVQTGKVTNVELRKP